MPVRLKAHWLGLLLAPKVCGCMSEGDHAVGIIRIPPQDRVIFGRPAAEAVVETADRLAKNRLLIVASKTLNRKTDACGPSLGLVALGYSTNASNTSRGHRCCRLQRRCRSMHPI
jgi:hypothetical protein